MEAIKLKDDQAALVINNDGTADMYINDSGDEDRPISTAELTVVALSILLSEGKPEFENLMNESFTRITTMLKKKMEK